MAQIDARAFTFKLISDREAIRLLNQLKIVESNTSAPSAKYAAKKGHIVPTKNLPRR